MYSRPYIAEEEPKEEEVEEPASSAAVAPEVIIETVTPLNQTTETEMSTLNREVSTEALDSETQDEINV